MVLHAFVLGPPHPSLRWWLRSLYRFRRSKRGTSSHQRGRLPQYCKNRIVFEAYLIHGGWHCIGHSSRNRQIQVLLRKSQPSVGRILYMWHPTRSRFLGSLRYGSRCSRTLDRWFFPRRRRLLLFQKVIDGIHGWWVIVVTNMLQIYRIWLTKARRWGGKRVYVLGGSEAHFCDKKNTVMAKMLNRKVTVYVSAKEVENTLKSLRAELRRLENQQKNCTMGSDEYLWTLSEIIILRVWGSMTKYSSTMPMEGISLTTAGRKFIIFERWPEDIFFLGENPWPSPKKKNFCFNFVSIFLSNRHKWLYSSLCDPGGIQTHDFRNRNPTFYSAELRGHRGVFMLFSKANTLIITMLDVVYCMRLQFFFLFFFIHYCCCPKASNK